MHSLKKLVSWPQDRFLKSCHSFIDSVSIRVKLSSCHCCTVWTNLHYTDRIGRYTPSAGNGCVKDIFGHARKAPCLWKSRVTAVYGIPMTRLILNSIIFKRDFSKLGASRACRKISVSRSFPAGAVSRGTGFWLWSVRKFLIQQSILRGLVTLLGECDKQHLYTPQPFLFFYFLR